MCANSLVDEELDFDDETIIDYVDISISTLNILELTKPRQTDK